MHDVEDVKYEVWSRTRLDRLLVDYLLRHGYNESARALADEDGGPAERLCRELTGYTGPSRTVAFGTDGGHFQAAGLSTVVCGPGSIDQAHVADEWIEVSELDAAERFLDGLVERLSR